MWLRSLRSINPKDVELTVMEVAAGNIKFGPPQSPPTWQPWLNTHMYHISNYYHPESVHLSHLIIRLRLTKQANTAALEARADTECLDQKLLIEAYLVIKYRGVIFLLLQQEVSDHFREIPRFAPTAVGIIFLIYSPPSESTLQRGKLLTLRQTTCSIRTE